MLWGRGRTEAGLDVARQEGGIGGRRQRLSPQQQAEIRRMVSSGDKTAADTARLFNINPATVSRRLTRANHSERPASKRTARAKIACKDLHQIIYKVTPWGLLSLPLFLCKITEISVSTSYDQSEREPF